MQNSIRIRNIIRSISLILLAISPFLIYLFELEFDWQYLFSIGLFLAFFMLYDKLDFLYVYLFLIFLIYHFKYLLLQLFIEISELPPGFLAISLLKQSYGIFFIHLVSILSTLLIISLFIRGIKIKITSRNPRPNKILLLVSYFIIVFYQVLRHGYLYKYAAVRPNLAGVFPSIFLLLDALSLCAFFYAISFYTAKYNKNKSILSILYIVIVTLGYTLLELLAGWKGPFIVFNTYIFYYLINSLNINLKIKHFFILMFLILIGYSFGKGFRNRNIPSNQETFRTTLSQNINLNTYIDFYDRLGGIEKLNPIIKAKILIKKNDVKLREVPKFYTNYLLGHPKWAIHANSPGFISELIILFTGKWLIVATIILALLFVLYKVLLIKNQYLILCLGYLSIKLFYTLSHGTIYAFLSFFLPFLFFAILFYNISRVNKLSNLAK